MLNNALEGRGCGKTRTWISARIAKTVFAAGLSVLNNSPTTNNKFTVNRAQDSTSMVAVTLYKRIARRVFAMGSSVINSPITNSDFMANGTQDLASVGTTIILYDSLVLSGDPAVGSVFLFCRAIRPMIMRVRRMLRESETEIFTV